ncbi:19591_t:CDS:2, partial [Racocetra persica]
EQTEQLEQPVPEQPLPSTNNNNQIRDKAIAKFNRLKEAYTVEGFNNFVKKNLDDAVLKINNKLDDINIEGGEVDYEEIKKKTKETCTETLAKIQDFLPSIIPDMESLLTDKPPPTEFT